MVTDVGSFYNGRIRSMKTRNQMLAIAFTMGLAACHHPMSMANDQ
tara:strand:+ start:289 stop:423 length:135 start_codon:yes stop_codon:yes gene_type:complete